MVAAAKRYSTMKIAKTTMDSAWEQIDGVTLQKLYDLCVRARVIKKSTTYVDPEMTSPIETD
jgi:hypothetical protein